MISYVYNPFSGNMDTISTITPYSAKNGSTDVYPGDTLVVEHTPVQNMGLLPLVFKFVASIGRTKVAFTMDWPEEYEQEIQGDIILLFGKMSLRNNAPPATIYRKDVRDLPTTNDVKTGTDLSAGWVYVDDTETATTSQITATRLKTTNTTDEIIFYLPDSIFTFPYAYYVNVYLRGGSVNVIVNNSVIALLSSEINNLNVVPISLGMNAQKVVIENSFKIGSTYFAPANNSGIEFVTDIWVKNLYSSVDNLNWSKTNIVLDTNAYFMEIRSCIHFFTNTFALYTSTYTSYKITTNGSTYTSYSFPGALSSPTLCMANNMVFCFSATESAVYYTTIDGITWLTRTAPFAKIYKNVVYKQGVYLLETTELINNNIYISTDLTSWQNKNKGTSVTGSMSVCGDFFVYYGNSIAYTIVSKNGSNWVPVVCSSTHIKPVIKFDGVYYGVIQPVGDSSALTNNFCYSLDCINWSLNLISSITARSSQYFIVSKNGLLNFISIATASYCYTVAHTFINKQSPIKTLTGQDVIKIKTVSGIAIIICIEINVIPDIPTITPSGKDGDYLLQNPNYVTPRYFITDSWDVVLHKALSITGITLTAETPSGSTVKALMSIDDGISWGKPNGTVLEIVSGSDLRSLLNSNAVDISSFGPVLQNLVLSDQKIKFAIDLQTTDTTVTPNISDISFQFIQSGLYQQVQTGEGTEWNVYNITENKTCFEYKGTQKATVFAHVLPLG